MGQGLGVWLGIVIHSGNNECENTQVHREGEPGTRRKRYQYQHWKNTLAGTILKNVTSTSIGKKTLAGTVFDL